MGLSLRPPCTILKIDAMYRRRVKFRDLTQNLSTTSTTNPVERAQSLCSLQCSLTFFSRCIDYVTPNTIHSHDTTLVYIFIYRTTKHSNNHVFHQCFEARCRTTACKKIISPGNCNPLSDQASDIVWRLYTTPSITKRLNV